MSRNKRKRVKPIKGVSVAPFYNAFKEPTHTACWEAAYVSRVLDGVPVEDAADEILELAGQLYHGAARTLRKASARQQAGKSRAMRGAARHHTRKATAAKSRVGKAYHGYIAKSAKREAGKAKARATGHTAMAKYHKGEMTRDEYKARYGGSRPTGRKR